MSSHRPGRLSWLGLAAAVLGALLLTTPPSHSSDPEPGVASRSAGGRYAAAPDNDHLAAAITIPGPPWFFVSGVAGATFEPGERTSTCGKDVGGSVWFRFAAPRTVGLEVSTIGSDFDTVLSVWMGQGHPLREIACNDDAAPGVAQSRLELAVRAETTVFLKVESAQQTGQLLFSVLPIPGAEPPEHDDLDASKAIDGLPFADSVDVRWATEETDQAACPCQATSGASVWYHFTAQHDQGVRFDTSGSGLDTVLSLWSGERHPLVHLACNDDVDRTVGDASSAVQLFARRGETYHLQIAAARRPAGVMNLRVAELPAGPEGDPFERPIWLELPAEVELDTTYATTEPGEAWAPCAREGGHSVWFGLQPAIEMWLRLDTLGSDYPVILALWQGREQPLEAVACATASWSDPGTYLEVILAAGRSYRLQVQGEGDTAGHLVLHATPITWRLALPLLFGNARDGG